MKTRPGSLRNATHARIIAKNGFSLFELLVVISIIGILTAIAIQVFGVNRHEARQAIYRSNARHIADCAAQAHAAGNRTIAAAASLNEALSLLRGGVNGSGALAGMTFRVAALSDSDWEKAQDFLSFEDGTLKPRL